MFFVAHLLISLLVYAVFFAGMVFRGILVQLLHALVAFVLALPGFRSYLENGIDPGSVKLAGSTRLIRGLAKNPVTAFALRRVDGLDILELDAHGRLHSVLHAISGFNGLDPAAPGLTTTKFGVLLLDGTPDPDKLIHFSGPIFLATTGVSPRVESDTVVVLDGAGEVDASGMRAPFLVHDAWARPVNSAPDTARVSVASLLESTRGPLLKIIRGESLTQPDPASDWPEPERRSLAGLLWRTAKIRRGRWFLGAEWSIDPAMLQTLVDQRVSVRERRPSRVVKIGPASMRINLLNPKVSLDGDRPEVTLDVGLEVASGPAVVRKSFRHPVIVRDVRVRAEKLIYDAGTGQVALGNVELLGLDSRYLENPVFRDLVIEAANARLRRAIGAGGEFDIGRVRTLGLPLIRWMLKNLEVREGRLHARVGVGTCADWLKRP